MSGRSAYLSKRLKNLIKLRCPVGVPTIDGKTISFSCQSSLSRSTSWRLRCSTNKLMVSVPSWTIRFQALVFGAENTFPTPLLGWSCRRTCKLFEAQSISSHFKPSSSPCRRPVVIAMWYRASYRLPWTAISRWRAWLSFRIFISLWITLGGIMALTGLRPSKPCRTAMTKALCNVLWVSWTLRWLWPCSLRSE